MLESVAYLDSLVEACVNAGVPANRIVLGGFSQGCAMSLLWYLTTSKYSDKLAGIVGLLGFLPLSDGRQRIQELRAGAGLSPEPPKLPLFLARGTKDSLISTRVWNYTLQGLKDLGVDDSTLDVHVYPGLEHTIHGPVERYARREGVVFLYLRLVLVYILPLVTNDYYPSTNAVAVNVTNTRLLRSVSFSSTTGHEFMAGEDATGT